jgi:phosphoribosylaminoimidazolecarboxamide formyltransferase/IMP cyclohydrolase
MAIRDLKGKVLDRIPVQNVLVSVFDKSGLEDFIPGLVRANPDVGFMSTGGTYKKLKEILGDAAAAHLREVAEYTEFPEMEGGLVKTLHPKIHAGLLGERGNPEHQRYLEETLSGGVYIDMVVVNLYPFDKVTSAIDVTFEKARGNIDIGGPTMIRAGAKNFPSCAVVSNPGSYGRLLEHMNENCGCTTFEERFKLAAEVFATMSGYEKSISTYFGDHLDKVDEVRANYQFADSGD